MAKVENVLEVIGNTPLVQLKRMVPAGAADIYAKLEFMNPGGSIKDRMARYIIEDAEKRGELKPGGTIVENTSGNTGVGVAIVAAVKGYKTIFTIPDKMSAEKINLLKAFGAKVVVTKTNVPADSPESYYETAKRIHRETPGSFYLNQYHNPKNIEAHYKLTGPEIWNDMEGRIDYFVAGIGTGGTLSGAGRFLKEKDPEIKIVAVDPFGSVFYDYFKTGKPGVPEVYKVEGIGEDMITQAMDFSIVDDMIQVTDKDCFLTARDLTTKEGMFAGGSSGAAVWGALQVAKQAGAGKRIVVVLPDSGTRYLSKMFSDEWMRDWGFLDDRPDLGSVQQILNRKSGAKVISAAPSDSLLAVIEKMKKHDISQLPVLENDELVGLIRESDMLGLLVTGKHSPTGSIASAIVTEYHTITPQAPVSRLAEMFSKNGYDVVFAVDNKKLVGILTKIDLIDYLAGAQS
jgi:cystathionine beta-synthase